MKYSDIVLGLDPDLFRFLRLKVVMIVMKFGGSSLRDAERIQLAYKLVNERQAQKPIVVCSALGSTTDMLLAEAQAAIEGKDFGVAKIRSLHTQVSEELGIDAQDQIKLIGELEEVLRGVALLKELSGKTKDYIVSFGERLAVRVVAAYFDSQKLTSKFHEAWDLGMLTNSDYGDAQVLDESYDNLSKSLGALKENYSYTPVVTGYIAKTKEGNITTLGRSGTDLTASIVGAALQADEIQLWKDVDGIMTTDPRLAPGAKSVPLISFEEASELAYFGAKVLHPLSIQPAMRNNVPVRVKNSQNSDHPGTEILGVIDGASGYVKALTCKRNVTLVDIVSTRMLDQYGFLAKVFQAFNLRGVSVDMVATSEISVSLTLNKRESIDHVVADLSEFATVDVSHGKAILSIIGNIARSSEILDDTFRILRENSVNVQMISQGASKVNIGLIVEDSEIEKCIQGLHKHFFED